MPQRIGLELDVLPVEMVVDDADEVDRARAPPARRHRARRSSRRRCSRPARAPAGNRRRPADRAGSPSKGMGERSPSSATAPGPSSSRSTSLSRTLYTWRSSTARSGSDASGRGVAMARSSQIQSVMVGATLRSSAIEQHRHLVDLPVVVEIAREPAALVHVQPAPDPHGLASGRFRSARSISIVSGHDIPGRVRPRGDSGRQASSDLEAAVGDEVMLVALVVRDHAGRSSGAPAESVR